MKARNEKIFVKIIKAGFIPQLGMCGPIPNPIKITRAQAYSMIIAGIKVYQYFPDTKYTEELTLQNIFSDDVKPEKNDSKVEEKDINKPVTPITLSGVSTNEVKTDNVIDEKKVFEKASFEEVEDVPVKGVGKTEPDKAPKVESDKSKTYNNSNKNKNKHK